MKRMNVEELKRQLDSGVIPVLLDVREPWEYEICRIEGSQNVPMSQITRRIHELDKEANTIVICHHGSRSWQVGSYLESCGFNNLINLEGGVSDWAEQIDLNMPRY